MIQGMMLRFQICTTNEMIVFQYCRTSEYLCPILSLHSNDWPRWTIRRRYDSILYTSTDDLWVIQSFTHWPTRGQVRKEFWVKMATIGGYERLNSSSVIVRTSTNNRCFKNKHTRLKRYWMWSTSVSKDCDKIWGLMKEAYIGFDEKDIKKELTRI